MATKECCKRGRFKYKLTPVIRTDTSVPWVTDGDGPALEIYRYCVECGAYWGCQFTAELPTITIESTELDAWFAKRMPKAVV